MNVSNFISAANNQTEAYNNGNATKIINSTISSLIDATSSFNPITKSSLFNVTNSTTSPECRMETSSPAFYVVIAIGVISLIMTVGMMIDCCAIRARARENQQLPVIATEPESESTKLLG